MLNHNLIRDRILLVAEPGMFTEQAIRDISAEAERYKREGDGPRQAGKVPELNDIRSELHGCLAIIKGRQNA